MRHRSRIAGLALAGLLAACGAGAGAGTAAPAGHGGATGARSAGAAPDTTDHVAAATAASPVSAAPLAADLRGGLAPMAMRLRLPRLGVDLPMASVGLTPKGAMDAPFGPVGSPVWREAFWYRGGSLPGAPGTATLAGHLDDTLGRPAAFWRLRSTVVGDEVDVLDGSSPTTLRFRVVEVDDYSLAQTATAAVLARLYGADAVAGRAPGPAADGRSHLSLVTCAGGWDGHEYDHRFVVYAVRES